VSAGRPSFVVSLLSTFAPGLPICSTNLPSFVNFKTCPSLLPLPPSQTNPFGSMLIPCSFSNQS